MKRQQIVRERPRLRFRPALEVLSPDPRDADILRAKRRIAADGQIRRRRLDG